MQTTVFSSILLGASLLVPLASSLVACATSNALFCESDEQCETGTRCNTEQKICELVPRPDGGDDRAQDDLPGVCAAEGGQCVPAAPIGWLGPVAHAVAAAGEPLTSCAGAFSEEISTRGSDIVEEGACDCSCGLAANLSCSDATLSEWTGGEPACETGICDVLGGTCAENSMAIPPNSCAEVQAHMRDAPYLRARMGTIESGSCESPVTTGTLESHLAGQDRLCAAELVEGNCATGETCAPSPGDDFDESLCIVREGEHECPAGSLYSERRLLYTGVDDQRSCETGTCSCALPTGSCGGRLELRGGDEFNCSPTLATLKPSSSVFGNGDICAATSEAVQNAAYLVNLTTKSCRRTGDPAITGQAVGLNPTTLCCI